MLSPWPMLDLHPQYWLSKFPTSFWVERRNLNKHAPQGWGLGSNSDLEFMLPDNKIPYKGPTRGLSVKLQTPVAAQWLGHICPRTHSWSFHLTFNPGSLPLSQHLSCRYIFSSLSSLLSPHPSLHPFHPSFLLSLSFLPFIHPDNHPPAHSPVCLLSVLLFISPAFLLCVYSFLFDHLFTHPSSHSPVCPSLFFFLPSFQLVFIFPACSLALHLFILPLSIQVSHLSVHFLPTHLSVLFAQSLSHSPTLTLLTSLYSQVCSPLYLHNHSFAHSHL